MSMNAPTAADTDDWTRPYDHLDFSREELAEAMRATYAELIAFVSQPAFAAAYREMWSLPPERRPVFVNEVFVNRGELEKRGVEIPLDILVQTSAFGDRRPTLFAVKKFLPERFHGVWENVNLTFDNEYADETVSRDAEMAWRKPLPVDLQTSMMAAGEDLDRCPDLGRHDPNWSQGLGESFVPRDS